MSPNPRILRSSSSSGEAVAVGRAARSVSSGQGLALPAGSGQEVFVPTQRNMLAVAELPSEVVSTPMAITLSDLAQKEAVWKARGHGEGYEEGLQEGRRLALENVEQRAQSLAQEMVRKALDEAQQTTRKQQSELQAQMQERVRHVEALNRLTTQIGVEWLRYLESAEDDMLDLAFDALCRIMGDHLTSKEGVRAVLQKALQAWHGRHPLSVHVHPDDLELLQGDVVTLDLLSSRGFDAQRQTLRWVADTKVRLGGCLIQAAEGALDARLERQMEALASRLVETRASRKHDALQASVREPAA